MSETKGVSPEAPDPGDPNDPDESEEAPARADDAESSGLTELAARLSKEEFAELVKLAARLPENTPPELVELAVRSIAYSGPVPPPAMVERYEVMVPGAADRFLAIAEREQGIRKRDNLIYLVNDTLRIAGSVVVSLALVGGGVYCGIIGQPVLGGILGASGAVPAVGKYFMKGRKE